jgi:L-alanine-DL-glutamate epimerase-like enolase superfamily enzyme
MKIQEIEFFRLDMPLAIPYTTSLETVSSATNIILKLVTDKGLVGWGCAAPDKIITGETPKKVISNIESVVKPLLLNQSPYQISRFVHILKEKLPASTSTIAMVDMALYDLLARKAKLPLYQVLGGYRDAIPTSITLGIISLKETIEQATYYLSKGFTILKLKGGLVLDEDIEKVLLLREKLGNDFVLRFDANQGYTSKESIEFIRKTTSAQIEIFEQPTSKKFEDKLSHVTKSVNVPVMADESLKTLKDAFRLASKDVIDMVNIKLMKVGGILESDHINSVAASAGIDVMIGCVDECALGISAGLHFALSQPNIEYADLDGHLDLLEDPFEDLFKLKNGILYPTTHAGLGNIKLS